ncbi:hypothetical protein EIP91_001807 [Steccherinum ochraceum]|uniref:Fungal-type protein kinase domain-containing protein n=1 Tax=Steccherinum ochraceum TaxID=92696 RepID=A0A4R0RSE7_9APHY|nr:hypothetical protein EIP91_001807 [Steccherinum ochraceum]
MTACLLPLQEVTSPEEFKKVFIGALQAHHAVYKAFGFVHQDLSLANIMFYRESRSEEAFGALCDWDSPRVHHQPGRKHTGPVAPTMDDIVGNVIAVNSSLYELIVHPTWHVENRVYPLATGTAPFVALDLLDTSTATGPQHLYLYRHDLESFFYILVWFASTFKPQDKRIGTIREWLKKDVREVRRKKSSAIRAMYPITKMVDRGSVVYREALKPWIDELLINLIEPTVKKHEDIRGAVAAQTFLSDTFKSSELSSKKTIASVSKAVYDMVVAREEIMTFQNFMRCLGEEVKDDQ